MRVRAELIVMVAALALPVLMVLSFGTSAERKLRNLEDSSVAALMALPMPASAPPEPVATSAVEAVPVTAPGAPVEDAFAEPLPGGTLSPSRTTPIAIESAVSAVDPAHWRVDLQIFNRGAGLASGRVHTVASIVLPDGRLVRVKGPAQAYSARRMTVKSVELGLADAPADARLTRLDVVVSNEVSGSVVTYTSAAH